MPRYTVLGLVDATVSCEVEADTPEEAAEAAAGELYAGVCCQCSRELNVADVYAVRVLDADGEEVWTDHEEDRLRAENERLRAVVEVVRAWRHGRDVWMRQHLPALVTALDALDGDAR